ncbi:MULTISPECIES: DUF234 domain-containing protein [unclassified Nitratiruptor]|uniref:DUF234 domain-containing protein n=1 Tax=unclassified Nitratiruptor TaxID=2624044 RepID=UPI00191656E9|nr:MULTISPECIES: DUF234 domain-containing protein [unclassified Nitratiruptor]BCD59980.1 hypothetical protein NitYY0810_C0743 [Nitratiruptor sp. YY08-10]BCD63903.1 hypothetical protein NitYY0814_C0742 [Nitratiruptor sp. YY08-14]
MAKIYRLQRKSNANFLIDVLFSIIDYSKKEGGKIKKRFIKLYKNFKRCEIEKAIISFSLFDGLEQYFTLDFDNSIEDNILVVLQNFEQFIEPFSQQNNFFLSALATGDRKIETAIKKSFAKEHEGYESLQYYIDQNIIEKEYSREVLPQKKPKQKLKKELRRYRIQHKAKFSRPFYRFWFRYIYPSLEQLYNKEFEQVQNFILTDLDNFVSFTFEELSNELLKERFPEHIRSGSYWDRKVEIDLMMELKNGDIIIGECKWKNSKICKKTLTSLQKKSQIAGFSPTYYALFSKSSFSNELLKSQEKTILLFDLEDFKEWSEEEAYKKREKKPYSFEF